ncbi:MULTISPECIES: NAD-glutamate dehydrogenase [unclassified Acinetobacter]|uniref:NAD-glutamate dehydrogenase n=1 Tax=unclassified Acinetobacter TaxID=196816 RepID=UPI0035B8CC3F
MSSLHLEPQRKQAISELAKVHQTDPAFASFMASYYKNLTKQNVQQLTDAHLAGMAVNHFKLFLSHKDGTPTVSVFNPVATQHHFDSDKTIIQMVVKDRPFLTDTMLMSLENQGLSVKRLFTTILNTANKTNITQAHESTDNDMQNKAFFHVEIERLAESDLAKVQQALLEKIKTIDGVVADWQPMRSKLQAIHAELRSTPIPEQEYSKYEVLSFLDWMSDNFIFMGFREYRFEKDSNELKLYSVGGSGLGLLKGQAQDTVSESFARLPSNLRELLTQPRVLLLSKSAHLSPVHRPVYMDYLGIQKFDHEGHLIGEYRFLGLLTARAYQTQVGEIPLLREKSNNILYNLGLIKNGHSYNKTVHIINTLPRDDLFQASLEELSQMVAGIANLQDKNELELFTRTDHYQRFVSCLVYIPKHKFDTELRIKIQQTLTESFGGVSSTFSTDFNELYHVRVHFHIRTIPGKINSVDVDALERKLGNLMLDWNDEYQKNLNQSLGLSTANTAIKAFNIPASYQERFDIATAVSDVSRLMHLHQDKPLQWQFNQKADGALSLNLYGLDTPVALSNVLPILENFGVSVVTAQTYRFDAQKQAWLQEYRLALKNVSEIDFATVKTQFENTLDEIWQGKVESDKLNELILTTTLDTYDVVVLRALSRYMIQATAPFSKDYIHQTLLTNRELTVLLMDLFHAKMSPHADKAQSDIASIKAEINSLLAKVKSLDEDRIIRWLLDLLNAMLRTNFYQVDENGQRKDRLSFKFKASDIAGLPKPKPMFEIYVYSTRTEGVHLRGGKVARGGLRWSDRMEDYRTEVLGLVKAQMVKNAVIVPVGSKGGFVVKDKSKQADRETWQKEGIACYQTYLRGLLDVTDNLIDGKVVPPANTVRHDEDDPYLVVAADKGTATFSDIANALSAEYNFWLQDAFASGGSAGYDHKGMGITARGAWESVKRHFRLQGKDIQARDDFSVVGIGDMSGDVFGNGMLLSKRIKLVVAFNHLHIFIDPNPNTESSYAERERLFKLPRSNWTDYDTKLISQGGGIFSRTDKSIAISPEMKAVFDIQEDSLTPNELLNKLLKAPVDLIWNGGIGTYIKSSEEEHSDVGDRANDAIRVNGGEVRAKVVGEGGNLGCTQQGRIEYALKGGQIYTDAIDNSGGVNCSDHEVNIKILLGAVVERAEMDVAGRNQLLASMTDDVAQLVLRQNYLQPQAIELSRFETVERLNENARFMQYLESKGRLDRAIEFLPSDEVIAQRQKAGQGLTNPEFAVLLAYGKMWVYDEMLASDLPDDSYFLSELKKYFPSTLASQYFDDMVAHRLHREIICTYLTNGLVNRLGIENVFFLAEEAGQSIADITRSYAIVRDVFGVQQLWDKLSALDNIAPATSQLSIEVSIRNVLKSTMLWFLNNEGVASVDKLANKYKAAIQGLMGNTAIFERHFANVIDAQTAALTVQGVPVEDAKAFARLPVLVHTLDVVKLADAKGVNSEVVAEAYFGVYNALNMQALNQDVQALPKASYWDRRATTALGQELNRTLIALASDALSHTNFTAWKTAHREQLDKLTHQLQDVSNTPSLASLSVLLSEMNGLKKA